MYSVVLMAALTANPTTPAFFFKNKSCNGCYGCAGSCYRSYSVSGCTGCQGGAARYGCSGCYGGYGYGLGYTYGAVYASHGAYACHGTGGCYGGCWGYAPYSGGVPMIDRIEDSRSDKKKTEKKTSARNEARLVIQVPADAKIYIDDQLMATQSGTRVFRTPNLTAGQVYYYIIRTEVVRDGKLHKESKRVLIRAGEETVARFDEPNLVVSQK